LNFDPPEPPPVAARGMTPAFSLLYWRENRKLLNEATGNIEKMLKPGYIVEGLEVSAM
jgi:hypothetical protein